VFLFQVTSEVGPKPCCGFTIAFRQVLLITKQFRGQTFRTSGAFCLLFEFGDITKGIGCVRFSDGRTIARPATPAAQVFVPEQLEKGQNDGDLVGPALTNGPSIPTPIRPVGSARARGDRFPRGSLVQCVRVLSLFSACPPRTPHARSSPSRHLSLSRIFLTVICDPLLLFGDVPLDESPESRNTSSFLTAFARVLNSPGQTCYDRW
jgi:hypothetical protein